MAKKQIDRSGPEELTENQLREVQGGMNKAELVEFIHKNGNISDTKVGTDRALGAVLEASRNSGAGVEPIAPLASRSGIGGFSQTD